MNPGLLESKGERISLAVLVTDPQHVRKLGDLHLAPACFRRLFEIAFGADVFNDALTVEALFEYPEGTVNWVAFADLYFNRHNKWKNVYVST